jgi:HlyD family secretion protein
MTTTITVPLVTWQGDVETVLPEPSLRRVALLSLLTIVLGFGGLLGWASLARLDSAVPATGVIVAAGKRKTVSLLDAGILKSLLVQEGDRVAAGQVLLQLDDVQARSAAQEAAGQYWGGIAHAARLQAEALDQRDMALPPDLRTAAADPGIAAEVDAETHAFHARWAAYDGAIAIQRRKIEQLRAQVTALQDQIDQVSARIGYFEDELRGVDYLLARGFATKPRALELHRNVAELRGQRSDLAGRLADAGQTIAQSELEIIATGNDRRTEIAKDRADTETALASAAQRLVAARDLLAKRVVTAPEDGIVTDLHFFTAGSSIGAGQPILDLVPADQHMLVEGSVAPNDIEHVHAGQRVNVRLTSYKAHRVPVVTGHLVYVAADRQNDAHNDPMFLVRAELDPGALSGLKDVTLYPGMPADILIIGGERSVLDFLISPIRDSIRHAMNEE